MIDINKLPHVRTVTQGDDLRRHRSMTRKIFQLSYESRVEILTNQAKCNEGKFNVSSDHNCDEIVEYERHSFILDPYRLSTTI